MGDATLMAMETPTGAVADLPAELTPEPHTRTPSSTADAAPAQAAPEPPAATPAPAAPSPAAPTPQDWQAERAGILRELSETRADRQASRQETARLAGMLEAVQKQITPPAAPAAVVVAGPSAQEIEDTARTLGLYKADGSGQLDLKTAAAVLAREASRAEAIAKRITDEQVTPLRQHVEAQQGEKGKADILAVMRQAGVEDRFTEAAIQNITGGNPKLLADVGVQTMVTLAAAGLQQLTGTKKIAPAAVAAATTAAAASMGTAAPVAIAPVAPAVPTAPATSVPDTGARPTAAATPELTALEKKAMRTHGIKPAEYAAFTAPLDKANETGRIPVGGFQLED